MEKYDQNEGITASISMHGVPSDVFSNYDIENPEESQIENQIDYLRRKDIDEGIPLSPVDSAASLSSSSSYDAFGHENLDDFPEGGWKAWTVVAGSALGLMTVFGVMDTISSIQLWISQHELDEYSLSTISWVFSLYMFTCLSMGTVSGPIFDIYGIKKILAVGMVLNCGGLLATAFCTELYQFVLAFGICTGAGAGMMFNPLVGIVSHWFLRNRGWANSLNACGSISGVFFPLMLRSLFPELGYKKSMIIMACLCMALSIPCLLMVEDRSDFLNREQSHIPKRERLIHAYKNTIDFRNFKEKSYLFLVLSIFFDEFSIIIVLSYIATYGKVRNVADSTTYIIVTVMNASGIVGKILPSMLSDVIGKFNVMLLIMSMMSIALFAIWLPYYNLVGFYMFAIIYGFGFGAVFALTPILIAQISKTKEFGSRFGTCYFVVAFSNLIAMPVGSQFIRHESATNYNHMIIFTGCSCVLGVILLLCSRTALVGFKIKAFV